MAANDFTDICNRSCYLARRKPSNAHAFARAGEYANEWHQTLCQNGQDYLFLRREGQVDLAADTDRYSYASLADALSLAPNVVQELLAMVDDRDGGEPLRRFEWGELETLAGSTQDDAPGRPTCWARVNDAFRVWPVPDSAVRVGVLVRIAPGTLAGASRFLVPDGWVSRLAVPYVASHLLWEDGSRDGNSTADRLQAEYDKALSQFDDTYAFADQDIALRSPGLTRDLETPFAEAWDS